jgi:hypothetical protein
VAAARSGSSTGFRQSAIRLAKRISEPPGFRRRRYKGSGRHGREQQQTLAQIEANRRLDIRLIVLPEPPWKKGGIPVWKYYASKLPIQKDRLDSFLNMLGAADLFAAVCQARVEPLSQNHAGSFDESPQQCCARNAGRQGH